MGKLLEKKKLWFWLYVAAEAAGLASALILAVAVVLDSASVMTVFGVLTAGMEVYILLYYAYRLLYLYRGTPDRVKWTVFAVIAIASGILEAIPVLGVAITLVGFCMAVACLFHDYRLVTG